MAFQDKTNVSVGFDSAFSPGSDPRATFLFVYQSSAARGYLVAQTKWKQLEVAAFTLGNSKLHKTS